MNFLSSALIGILLAIASMEWSHACAVHDATKEQALDDANSSLEQPVNNARSLSDDISSQNAGSGPPASAFCGTPTPTKNQVSSFVTMVDQYYQGQQGLGGNRRLQETIAIGVNFVIFKDSVGAGSTLGQMRAQIDILNNAFRPDFAFTVKTTQVVTNDNFFTNVGLDDGPSSVHVQMKTAYKRGGMETLNVYVLDILDADVALGFAYLPFSDPGVLDGVVLDFTTMPYGGSTLNQGDVRARLEVLLSSRTHRTIQCVLTS
jgi:hypothetical protein